MAKKRGIFIAIEGTDSSGKGTQTAMLKDWFDKKGLPVMVMGFPAYDTPWGKEVARYLRGEFGPLDEVPPEIPALLYAGDRYQFGEKAEAALAEGTNVISDRWTGSNIGYQAAKFEGEERVRFIEWIEKVEERLPKPDLVIFLNMPLEVAGKLIEGRGEKGAVEGGGKDIHEKDVEYLRRVGEVYEHMMATRGNWVRVECARGMEPRGRGEVHGEVVRGVEGVLGG